MSLPSDLSPVPTDVNPTPPLGAQQCWQRSTWPSGQLHWWEMTTKSWCWSEHGHQVWHPKPHSETVFVTTRHICLAQVVLASTNCVGCRICKLSRSKICEVFTSFFLCLQNVLVVLVQKYICACNEEPVHTMFRFSATRAREIQNRRKTCVFFALKHTWYHHDYSTARQPDSGRCSVVFWLVQVFASQHHAFICQCETTPNRMPPLFPSQKKNHTILHVCS